MATIDRHVPVQFLQTAFEAGDWIGVLLKTYRTGQVLQRIVPRDTAASERFQAWLRHMNAHGWNVYVSVNAYRPGRSRAREAVARVRHLFLEEDHDGPGLLAALSTRPDLPPPSYVLHSSPSRLHALWRVRDVEPPRIEQLQKHLACELATDQAATSCAQTTRLPGLFYLKAPIVRTRVKCLILQPVANAAVTDSGQTKRLGRRRRTSSSSSGASFLATRKVGDVKANRAASTSRTATLERLTSSDQGIGPRSGRARLDEPNAGLP